MRQFYYVIQTLLFDYSVECGYEVWNIVNRAPVNSIKSE